MTEAGYSWDIRKDDPMMIDITLHDELLFSIFVGEAMEIIGRDLIMQHVKACEDTPWLKHWHKNGVKMNAEPTLWTIKDLENKKDVMLPNGEWCVLASKERSDEEMHDISRFDGDYVWCLISTVDGEYRLNDIEPKDMVQFLNLLSG